MLYEKDTNNIPIRTLTTKLSSTKIIGNIVKKYLNSSVKKLNQLSTKLIVNNTLEKYCLRKTVIKLLTLHHG